MTNFLYLTLILLFVPKTHSSLSPPQLPLHPSWKIQGVLLSSGKRPPSLSPSKYQIKKAKEFLWLYSLAHMVYFSAFASNPNPTIANNSNNKR